jgi:hypothetical protein
MDIKGLDNFNTLVIVFVIIALLYLFVFSPSEEPFEVPAPATLIKQSMPIPVPRQVSPSGPSPPNSRIPDSIAKINDVYNVIPNDPQDEKYSTQNFTDNLRYPERSFGPGIVNGGSKLMLNSGIASPKMLNTSQPIQPFATELVQNGGMMGSIGPDDTKTDPNYASF